MLKCKPVTNQDPTYKIITLFVSIYSVSPLMYLRTSKTPQAYL